MLRNLAGQKTLFGLDAPSCATGAPSTFSDNLSLPVHRWFKYSAGFSALWVREVIGAADRNRRVLDPFAGSGTVLVESEQCGAESIGIESHPFVVRIAKAKLLWRSSAEEFGRHSKGILARAARHRGKTDCYAPLIQKCYPPEAIGRLNALHQSWLEAIDGTPASELCWLALASVLRPCSPAGTANWQYILPKKTKARVLDAFDAFGSKAKQMKDDMRRMQNASPGPISQVFADDARQLTSVPDGWANLVITSPPYPNNFDYADATRLEMSFFGDINGWSDLQESVRKYLIRSCTQHVSPIVAETGAILARAELKPIREEIVPICLKLEHERLSHGGKKNYHTMIAAYFSDMAKTWIALRRVVARGGRTVFVIGDSAPYGIHVPVERWLGQLAVAAGFRSFSFEKTRDRNIKWKNRKHRVPLHEGRLWVEG
jgi:hypothetical protein